MWSRLAVVGAFLFLMADGVAAMAADPPARVGRLSLVEGTVSLRSPQLMDADNATDNATPQLKDEWVPATLNYPVTSGNSLWTESGARAELQVGPAEVRLDEQTELEVLRLDDRSVDLALHQGTANIHIGGALPGGLLIDTPRGPVTLTQPGSYRIDVDTGSNNPADSVQVTAFEGQAKVSIETPERTDTHTVERGRSLGLSGEPVEIALADARATAFDDWARSRDFRAIVAARPVVTGQPVSQTVSPVSTQMTGYQDLAPYGTWEPAPNYGPVWYPATVTPDWAPYRHGRWAYVAPWGWTWIDDAPWGFTPFHYGRWVRVGPRWAWWPGHRSVRPVYAPALVAFVGGNGWSVGIGSGHRNHRARPVGWVPLAPYEVYRPHYRTSATYIRNVNITTVNKTVINNITVNSKNTDINRFTNRNAVTAVTADNFARGRKVNEAKIDVSHKDIERAKATNDVRAIKPAGVALKADQPRPVVRKEDGRRAPNPAVMSREPDRPDQLTGQRRDPAIERRNAAIQTAPKNAVTPQAQPQQRPRKHQAREERRAPESERNERVQQLEQRRDATPQPTQRAVPAAVLQRQPPNAQERQQRDQAEQQQRRQRDEAQAQQPREQKIRPQQNQAQQNQPAADQPRRREDHQRQQAGQQQRVNEQVREQRQREAQDEQKRDVQRREPAMREQRQREVAQEQQQREQQQRQQAEAQQRQVQNHQRRQQEAQQRQQAEQRQQRAQQDQQRQQRDQAQQQPRRQEQARGEQPRRNPENRADGKRDRAG